HLLRRDPRLGLLELGPALFVLRLSLRALVAVLLRTIEIALQLAVANLKLVELGALFGIVLAAENLARLHGLSLAAAQIDQATALQRNYLGPSLRLYGSSAEHRLGDGSELRNAGRDEFGVKEIGIEIVGTAGDHDQQDCYDRETADRHCNAR